MSALATKRRMAEQTKPISGDISRDANVSWTFPQFTPSPNTWPGDINEFAKPTPMMDPIKLCELEAGSPRYQVPAFQMMAEINKAKTIAKPALDPTLRTSSTGSKATIPYATAPLETSTPIKFHIPDQTTATVGGR